MKVPISNPLISVTSPHILNEHYQVNISSVSMNFYIFFITMTNHHIFHQVLSSIYHFAIITHRAIFSIFLLSLLAILISHFRLF